MFETPLRTTESTNTKARCIVIQGPTHSHGDVRGVFSAYASALCATHGANRLYRPAVPGSMPRLGSLHQITMKHVNSLPNSAVDVQKPAATFTHVLNNSQVLAESPSVLT